MTTCPPGCGACCEAIPYGRTPAEVADRLMWLPLDERTREDLTFIALNWTLTDKPYPWDSERDTVYECAKFDPVSRACTAYDDRPPICADYPLYRDNRREKPVDHPGCAFVADTFLPSGTPRLLPLVEVR